MTMPNSLVSSAQGHQVPRGGRGGFSWLEERLRCPETGPLNKCILLPPPSDATAGYSINEP